jgi:hypothetical protein
MDYDRKQERRNRWKRKKHGKRNKFDKKKKKNFADPNPRDPLEQWALDEYNYNLDRNRNS